jgi:hypothetical protein
MKTIGILALLLTFCISSSCKKEKSAGDIIETTIQTMDTIETIFFRQLMSRTNPGMVNDTIFRVREMYFKRLIGDSIVGVKGHWYFLNQDGSKVDFEDIYDGNRLIRKNNVDSLIRLYDLVKHSKFKEAHFWSHNTLYAMQFTLRYMLTNYESYSITRLKDTIMMGQSCFQIEISLENQSSLLPGFAYQLEESVGDMSKTIFFIDKNSYYPIRMYEESYSVQDPDQKYFIDQIYYDIEFNLHIDEAIQFDTSTKEYEGYSIAEMEPNNPVMN